MAYACDRVGFNSIAELGVLVQEDCISMEAQSRQSRIPKFGFGFKKLMNGSSDKNKEPSPVTVPAVSVSRSRSMRVPRTQAPPIVKRDHSNSIDNSDEGPLLMSARESTSSLRPRSKTVSSRSHPNSRCNSPQTEGPSGRAESIDYNEATLTTSVDTVVSNYRAGHRRTHSFGAKERHVINRPSSSSSNNRRPVNNTRPPPSIVPASSVTGGKGRLLQSSNSRVKITNSVEETDGNVISYTAGVRPAGGRQGTPEKKTLSGHNKRPFSFHEGSPDLNQLASEMTQEEESRGGANRPQVQHNVHPQRPTLSSQGTRISSSKLRPPTTKRNSSDDLNRPSSAASNHIHIEARGSSRPRSAADVHRVNVNNPSRQSSQPSQGSRSSTPSSGRSTPLFRKTAAGIVEEDEEQTNEEAKAHHQPVTPHRPPHSRPTGSVRMGRTPVIRTSSNKSETEGGVLISESGVGLNELEGSVLIDAEDYRRMVQEVKTLKTMLLRLKRELTADGGSTPPSATPPTSMKSSVVRLKQVGGANNTELLNKIQKLTSERDKALLDIEQSKKDQKTQQHQLESLKANLDTHKKENASLTKKLTELETHREYLLDRLERLHADKHKVEDRLNTLEKSAVYERTILEGLSPPGEDQLMIDDDLENGLYYDDEDATY